MSFESCCYNDVIVAVMLCLSALVFPLGDFGFGINFLHGSVLEEHIGLAKFLELRISLPHLGCVFGSHVC